MLDADYWAGIVAKYADRPTWTRPPIFNIANDADRDDQRAWLADAVGRLGGDSRTHAVSSLEEEENFLATYNELATTEILVRSDHAVAVDPVLSGLTPDVVVLDAAGRPAVIVEVSTRFRSDDDRREERRWRELKHRVERIPIPIGIAVTGEDQRTPPAPDSGTAKKLVQDLQRRLSVVDPIPYGYAIEVGSYWFHLVNEIPGTHSRLAPPTTTGWRDAEEVLESIKAKVDRYAEIAAEVDAPLLVVIAAEPESPVSAHLLKAALLGRQSTAITLDLFHTQEVGPIELRLHERDAPIRFHPALSAVGWLAPGTSDPGTLTVFQVASRQRSLRLHASRDLRLDALSAG